MPRNRGKPTLHDISRAEPPLDERRKVADTAYNYEGSPIVTAILGTATIEMELEIRCASDSHGSKRAYCKP